MGSSPATLRLNLPTALTLSRIVVIPVFVWIAPLSNFWGMVIFSLASITDFLDGYLARRSGQVTTFGVIIDPIADKFFVIAALIVLVDMGRVSVLAAVIVIVREFLITALRAVALARDIVIKAEAGGKLKVGFQIAAVICLLLAGPEHGVYLVDGLIALIAAAGIDLYDAGTVCLWISIALGVGSGIQYMVNFWKRTISSPQDGVSGEGI